jgi:hypothetical protein
MAVDELQVNVIVDETVNDEALGELGTIFQEVGVTPAFEATYKASDKEDPSWAGSRRKAFRTDTAGSFNYDPDWIVLIVARVNELARHLGADEMKSLVGKIWTTRIRQTGSAGNAGLVMLVDDETGIRVTLEREMSPDAYDALTDLDLRAFQSDPLQFFRGRGRHGRWRSPDNVSGTG